jgi:hypothetical protein
MDEDICACIMRGKPHRADRVICRRIDRGQSSFSGALQPIPVFSLAA